MDFAATVQLLIILVYSAFVTYLERNGNRVSSSSALYIFQESL